MEDKLVRKFFENEIEDIATSPEILDANRKVLLEFLKFKQGQGLSYSRLNRVDMALKPIFKSMKYSVKTIDDKKAQEIVIAINSNPKWKDWTKNSNVKVFKNFLRWLSLFRRSSLPYETYLFALFSSII